MDKTIDPPNNRTIRLGYFRAADFTTSIGQTDWRVGLYLPEYGFDTWIFGRGEKVVPGSTNATLISVNGLRVPILRTFQVSLAYARQASKLGFDVILCDWSLSLAAMLCKRLRPHIKVILDVRSIPVETSGLLGFLFDLYFRTAVKSQAFDAVSIITNSMLSELDERFQFTGRVPTVIWGSGFDDAIFIPSSNDSNARKSLGLQNEWVLMFHGSHSPTRGLDQAIRCIRLLRDGGVDDVRLVFVGEGSAKSRLVQLARELGVEEAVGFFPSVPHHEIPALVAACDMGIDPLPDHPWWRHQSPLKVFEYLAMSKPVLATDIPCHHGISDAVILTRDNAPATLAAAVLQYRDLPTREKKRLQNTALRDAQRHTWRAKAKVLADFIRSEVQES